MTVDEARDHIDDSVGAFTATAMLPDELAAVLLDKARDEAATAAGQEQEVDRA